MRQLELFNDPAREEAEKERGMRLAAERPDRREVLRLARRLEILRRGPVTAWAATGGPPV